MNNEQFIGSNLIELDSIGSTNNYLSKLANETFVENGSVILAHNQTNGKGQRGNGWESESGKNLTFSVLLQTEFLKISQNFLLSMMVCNSVHELLSQYIDKVEIKWPNDILVDNKKIAGILIENSIVNQHLHQSIIGIGVNLNQRDFSTAPQASSLALLLKKELNKKEVFTKLLTIIERNYLELKQGLWFRINSYYLNHLLGYKTEQNYQIIKTKERITGRITEVEHNGFVRIMTSDRRSQLFEMKEIKRLV